MPLVIREVHPASAPALLNEEWLLLENTGQAQINTASCTLTAAPKGKKNVRGRIIGTLDPGFQIKPGEKVRMVSGSPAKKAQGTPPPEGDGIRNYHLFLREPILAQPGLEVRLLLNQHELCSVTYVPESTAQQA